MAPQHPKSASEDALVLKSIAGDSAAFHELILRRQAWLRSVLRRLTNDATLADDLSQDALFKAWRKINKLDDHRLFGPWLRRIAVRVWIDWARSRRLDFSAADPELIEEPTRAGGVNTADHRLDLEAAIGALRPGPRTCIVLFYGEGMSHSDIAALTGLPLGAVKSHIARGTLRLRKALAEWSHG